METGSMSRRVAATLLATTLAMGGVGFGGENKTRAEADGLATEMRVAGKIPSQTVEITTTARDEVEKRVKDVKIEAPSVPREVVMDLMKQYDQNNLGKYYQELKEYGCTDPDRLEACAKWLYSIDGFDSFNKKFKQPEFMYIGNYLSREKVLEYSVSGKGLNVYYNEENKPRFLIVVAADKPEGKNYQKGVDKITKNFKAAFEYMKQNGADDAVEAIWENGFSTFFACNYSEGDYSMGKLYEEGVIMGNFDAMIDKKDFQLNW